MELTIIYLFGALAIFFIAGLWGNEGTGAVILLALFWPLVLCAIALFACSSLALGLGRAIRWIFHAPKRGKAISHD